MNQLAPCGGNCNDHLIYWWHAQSRRRAGSTNTNEPASTATWTGSTGSIGRRPANRNGETLLHNYYDDMEWIWRSRCCACTTRRAARITGKRCGALGKHQTAMERPYGRRHGVEERSARLQEHPGQRARQHSRFPAYQRFRRPEDLEWARKNINKQGHAGGTGHRFRLGRHQPAGRRPDRQRLGIHVLPGRISRSRHRIVPHHRRETGRTWTMRCARRELH